MSDNKGKVVTLNDKYWVKYYDSPRESLFDHQIICKSLRLENKKLEADNAALREALVKAIDIMDYHKITDCNYEQNHCTEPNCWKAQVRALLEHRNNEKA